MSEGIKVSEVLENKMIKQEIEQVINDALKSLNLESRGFIVEHPDLKMGDYSTNVAIKHGHKDELFQYIDAHKPNSVEKVELAGPGFINFYLSKEFFKKSLGEIIEKGEVFGKGEHAKGYKVMVEHTQPNPFKALHIGHMMNNTIGEAISRIIQWNGADVRTATYHGDVGLHVAKAVYGLEQVLLQREHYQEVKKRVEAGASEGLVLLEDTREALKHIYASGNLMYESDENAKKEILLINKKIYEGKDPWIMFLYKAGRQASLAQFEELYVLLGSKFDYHFYESESGDIGKEVVLKNTPNIFEESDGAVVYKGEKVGLHTRVFLNSEKLPTYEAKEIGLVQIKSEKFAFDNSLTITGNEQDAFFQVVEAATGEVFPNLKGKIEHKGHGMLRLPTGKMSSRTGDVITAETLIEMVAEKIKSVMEKTDRVSGPVAEKDTAEKIAIGAIKYMILRSNIGSDIIFDIEKSVSTEGDSGVYLQYAHARANSILEKAGRKGSVEGERKNTHEIEKLLYRFPEIVERAGAEYAPNYVINYVTELASAFNNFYAHEPVLEESPESAYRLAIVEAFKIVMRNSLNILGIPAPERM